jgi:hypothetical protein
METIIIASTIGLSIPRVNPLDSKLKEINITMIFIIVAFSCPFDDEPPNSKGFLAM